MRPLTESDAETMSCRVASLSSPVVLVPAADLGAYCSIKCLCVSRDTASMLEETGEKKQEKQWNHKSVPTNNCHQPPRFVVEQLSYGEGVTQLNAECLRAQSKTSPPPPRQKNRVRLHAHESTQAALCPCPRERPFSRRADPEGKGVAVTPRRFQIASVRRAASWTGQDSDPDRPSRHPGVTHLQSKPRSEQSRRTSPQ